MSADNTDFLWFAWRLTSADKNTQIIWRFSGAGNDAVRYKLSVAGAENYERKACPELIEGSQAVRRF